ncbi:cell division ATP-binding protein FtsE, partial [Candidatus Falkowbacteria bacterium CG23_combo_of_CG06-09_8_20_14_all_41_10]
HNREIVNHLKKRVIAIDKGRVVSDQEKGKYLL